MTGSQWVGVILVALLVAGFFRLVSDSWREAGTVVAILSGAFAAAGLLAFGALLLAGAVTL